MGGMNERSAMLSRYADNAKTILSYKSGRESRKTYDESGQNKDFMIFNNTKVQSHRIRRK